VIVLLPKLRDAATIDASHLRIIEMSPFPHPFPPMVSVEHR
jgi:hypothetical protein